MHIGPHLIQLTPAGLDWARRAPIVKQLNGTEALRAARDDALRVFRRYFPQQPFDDPAGAATAILTALGGYRHRLLLVELYNEVAQRLGEGLEQHTIWTYAVTERLHDAGLRVAGFSFSTGNPGRDDWRYLRDCDYASVDVLAMHAYWGDQGFTLDHALRHRQVHEWTGGEHPPICLTEMGRDAVEGGKGGWCKDGISAADYVSELWAYGHELEADPYVIGAVVFTAGPTPDWDAFSTDGLDVSALTAAPTPPVEVTPVTLAEQYPVQYQQWVAAGGIESNLRAHLLGIGVLTPTKADVPILAGQVKAATDQLTNVVARLPFA
jgi:hypothetical protein